jgi:hypothetical protein
VVARDGATRKVARTVTSCAECLAWGLTYVQGACLACYNFSAAHLGHPLGECAACRRTVPLRSGFCRLCWCQAREDRAVTAVDARSAVVIAPHLPNVGHHQLFLAGMTKRTARPRVTPRRYGAKGRPRKPPPPHAARPRTQPEQLCLFAVTGKRDWNDARVDLRRGPAPDNPWLAWALHLAHTTAEARGWHPIVRRSMQRALVALLGSHRAGEQILASTVREITAARSVNIDLALEILQTMDVVDDDRPRGFARWLTPLLEPLSPAIGRDVETWAWHLHDGTPRSAPRRRSTAQAYFRLARPVLLTWSIRYDHLREVTRDDIVDHLTTLTGELRHTTATALRSLFSWARRTNIVFVNPASRIRLSRREHRLWQPLPDHALAAATAAMTRPHARVFLVLAAVHAARTGAVRALHLEDVNLGDRRLTIAGHERPIDQLTHDILRGWLAHRRRRWPTTANPHLLISKESALHHGPVSHSWARALRGLDATLEQIRIDRQLEEALSVGFDPLHLAEVFKINPSTAVRYALNARALLQRPHEAHDSGSSRTP